MKFTKMQGIGNDYVYVNCFEERVGDPAALSRMVSNRNFGIGSDGLILIKPSDVADCEMDIYNADGSRAKMCGNGIRCVAKYVYDHGIRKAPEITIDTASGPRTVQIEESGGKVRSVRVNMGPAILTPSKIPVDPSCFPGAGEAVVSRPLTAAGKSWDVTCVSMGNPHCVVFADDVEALALEKIGPSFENHPAFPDRINTEFIQVTGPQELRMRVWERGSGETMACGTGACAAAVAAVLNKKADDRLPVTVVLNGGSLQIEWDRAGQTVYMTGPAQEVFTGEIEVNG